MSIQQQKIEPQIPIVDCPSCEKKRPMAIKSLPLRLRGKESIVELICTNCGTTLVRELASS